MSAEVDDDGPGLETNDDKTMDDDRPAFESNGAEQEGPTPPPPPPETGAASESPAGAPTPMGPETDPFAMEGPFDCFKRREIWDQLRSHPTTRQFAFDTGFVKSVEDLQKTTEPQALAAKALADPRLMQAMGALQGWGLDVAESDLRKAERVGDMPKRDAVQLKDYAFAHEYTTPLEAKEAGNKCFKEGEWSKALGCWLKVLHLIATALQEGKADFPPPEPSLCPTIHSNCAAALLKLDRPADALSSALEAVRVATPGFDPTKAYHRASQAHEALARANLSDIAADNAVTEWTKAVAQAKKALESAQAVEAVQLEEQRAAKAAHMAKPATKASIDYSKFDLKDEDEPKASKGSSSSKGSKGSGSSGGGGGSGSSGGSVPGSAAVRTMQRELWRLKDELKASEERLEKVRAQSAREAEASARRGRGLQVSQAPETDGGKAAAGSSTVAGDALVAQERGVVAQGATLGYVRDIDLSVFAANWLAKEVCGLEHSWADGPGDKGQVKVTALEKGKSDIHASIKEKRGKRSLFYDLSIWLKWTATAQSAGTKGEMQGVLKLYNVAQDTRFQLGGDKETCYMYELGFPPQFHAANVPPWAARIREEVPDLFERVSKLVTKKFVPAVEAKGELVR